MTAGVSGAQMALAGVRAFSQMQAARAQAKGLAAQATMARLQAKQESLKYKEQAVKVLDNILQTQAAITARAGAGGIDAFTGSAGKLAQFALASGARELYTVQDNQVITLRGGEMQAQQYLSQAKSTMQAGMIGAIGTMIEPFAQPAIGGPPPSGLSPTIQPAYINAPAYRGFGFVGGR